jgi:UDP-N-acetylenolpyruvoylglucosamine reductase
LFEDPRAGSTAAELLARSDLLGVRVRGARIDEVTPNQLLADEGASARDVELLLEWAQGKVRGEWGVELTVALRIVGARARG